MCLPRRSILLQIARTACEIHDEPFNGLRKDREDDPLSFDTMPRGLIKIAASGIIAVN